MIYHLIPIIYYLADLSLQKLTEKNAGLILLGVLPLPTSVLEGGIVGGWKIVIFRSSILNLGLLNRKLYVDFKIGLNLENPIANKSVDHYSSVFLGDTLYIILFNRAYLEMKYFLMGGGNSVTIMVSFLIYCYYVLAPVNTQARCLICFIINPSLNYFWVWTCKPILTLI